MDRSITRNCLRGFDGLLKRVLLRFCHGVFGLVCPVTCLLLLLLFLNLNPEPQGCQGKCSTAGLYTQLPPVTQIQTVATVVALTIYSLEDVKGHCCSVQK